LGPSGKTNFPLGSGGILERKYNFYHSPEISSGQAAQSLKIKSFFLIIDQTSRNKGLMEWHGSGVDLPLSLEAN